MRLALMIGVAVSALMLSSCASTRSNFIADNLPEWAGGLPPDAPPRQGAPGYRDYVRKLSGEEGASTTAAPAGPAATPPASTASMAAAPAQNPPNPPPRRAPDSIDKPIH